MKPCSVFPLRHPCVIQANFSSTTEENEVFVPHYFGSFACISCVHSNVNFKNRWEAFNSEIVLLHMSFKIWEIGK